MDWCLYDNGLRHERVNGNEKNSCPAYSSLLRKTVAFSSKKQHKKSKNKVSAFNLGSVWRERKFFARLSLMENLTDV